MNRFVLALIGVSAIVLVLLTNRTAALPPEQTVPEKPAIAPKPPEEPNQLKLPTRKETMAMKLKSSQVILEGIAMNDFDKIHKAAKELVTVSNATDFLNAYKGTEYQFHIETFRRPAEVIAKKAKDKNMDGVMVAYNDLTLSCLKCHQSIRDKKFEINLEKYDGR